METESLKLVLIERLMRVQEASTLKRMEELITQAELESRAQESLEAIAKGEVLTMDEFGDQSRKWLKKKYTK